MNETRNLYRQAINTLLRGIAYEDYKGAAAEAVKILVESYNADPDAYEDDDDGDS